jgi:hypothetical protein
MAMGLANAICSVGEWQNWLAARASKSINRQ